MREHDERNSRRDSAWTAEMESFDQHSSTAVAEPVVDKKDSFVGVQHRWNAVSESTSPQG
jgi:hypothetical protein